MVETGDEAARCIWGWSLRGDAGATGGQLSRQGMSGVRVQVYGVHTSLQALIIHIFVDLPGLLVVVLRSSASNSLFTLLPELLTALAARDSLPGVDHNHQRASYFCAFPRLPIKRPGESTQDSFSSSPGCSTPRNLPPYTSGLHRRQDSASSRPRILPVVHVNLSLDSPALSHRRQPTPPKPVSTHSSANTNNTRPPRTVFTSAAQARPLRLVQESLLHNRKRRAPVFYAQASHSFVQSRTYITIRQSQDSPSAAEMASNNTNPAMPKVAPPLPSLPGGEGKNKDRLLADLRRQVFSSQFYPPQLVVGNSRQQREGE